MARQSYDLQLTRYGDEGWRATFYPAGRGHSVTSAVGSAWEREPWLAVPCWSDATIPTSHRELDRHALRVRLAQCHPGRPAAPDARRRERSLEKLRGARRLCDQGRLDGAEQVGQAQRLRQAPDDVQAQRCRRTTGLLEVAGDDEYRDPPEDRRSVEHLEKRGPVHFRHPEIEQDEVGDNGAHELERLTAVAGLEHPVPDAAERVGPDLAEAVIVVRDENPLRGGGGHVV